MRTAGGSTTQKWPENLLSSARKTERIPGSAVDEMEGDETECYHWTGSDWGQKFVNLHYQVKIVLSQNMGQTLQCRYKFIHGHNVDLYCVD